MKNKLKSLAIITLASLSLFSCSKGDDSSKSDEPTGKKIDAVMYITVSQDLQSFFDQSYHFDVAGTDVKFSIKDMTEVAESALPEQYKDLLDEAIGFDHKDIAHKTYSYKLGTMNSGQKVKGVTGTYTVKSDRPAQETLDIIRVYFFPNANVGSQNYSHTSVNIEYPTDEAALTKYAQSMSKSIPSIIVVY